MSRTFNRGNVNLCEMSSSSSELELRKIHTNKKLFHSNKRRLMNPATNCESNYEGKADICCKCTRNHSKPMVFFCNYCIVSGSHRVVKSIVDDDKAKATSKRFTYKTCRHCKIRKICFEILQSYHANICRKRDIMANSETSSENSNKERIKLHKKYQFHKSPQRIVAAGGDKLEKIRKNIESKKVDKFNKIAGKCEVAEPEKAEKMLNKIQTTKNDQFNKTPENSEVGKSDKGKKLLKKKKFHDDKLNKTPEKNGSRSSKSDEEVQTVHSSILGKYKENQQLRSDKKIPHRRNLKHFHKKLQKDRSFQQKGRLGKKTLTRLEEVGVSDFLRIRLENLDCRNMKLSKCQNLCQICKCKCFCSINRCHHHMSHIHFISNKDQCTNTLRKC